jgi:uncharacterized protein (DUF1778 family)
MAHSRQGKRAALLVQCSSEEAEMIRKAAQQERRTISGYILHAVMQRIAFQRQPRHVFPGQFGCTTTR